MKRRKHVIGDWWSDLPAADKFGFSVIGATVIVGIVLIVYKLSMYLGA